MSDQPTSSGLTPFAAYAEWYDAFNEGKDYAAEARYVFGKAQRWCPAPERWLDIGCGTGTHLACLAGLGVSVEGVDRSPEMIAEARLRHPGIPFQIAHAQDFDLPRDRDVVSMLFHVLSYQTTDSAVERALHNAATHLSSQGVLIVDFWHTGGVLRDPPRVRTRQALLGDRTLYRIAHPTENRAAHLIDIRYEFRWDEPEGPLAHEERHSMRHFTVEGLEQLLRDAGLEPLTHEAWMQDRPIGDDDWYGLICARKA